VLALAGVAVACVAGTTGCDRVKNVLRPANGGGDPRWTGDSTLLASKADFLFRVRRTDGDVRVVPIATIGAQGFRPLYFSDRGWRAFDVQYLQKGSKLTAYRAGQAAGEVEMLRGMWEPPSEPLDTIPGCPSMVPSAKAAVSEGVGLLINGAPPPLKPVKPLSAGELEQALHTVPTLVAPTSGVSGSILARYKREVHVVNTGTSSSPSIVLVYDDPEQLPDSIAPIAQRPRHLVVVMDRGVYGYRPTFTYATAGNTHQNTPLRYYYVDYLDVDGDGRAELFFGTRDPRVMKRFPVPSLYTIVLRFENEAWREMLRYDGSPCQF
jgi:hypothetical protein